MDQTINLDEIKKIKRRRKRRRGIVLIAIGFFALVTPFTPGSWLIFVGLEMLGVHWILFEKLEKKYRFKKPAEQSDV